MIKSWVFEFFQAPAVDDTLDPQRSAAYFNGYLDIWARAESLGFHGIFFSEHHFGPAYSPSPNLLVAQIAARTKSLRLGVMGMVLPYHQPWRIVEEIGMLDHLTGGRFEIGTSAGIPNEMEKVGLGVEEARARNDEAQDIIDAALRAPVTSHHGKYWRFDNLRLVPRPLQQPTPPVWTTVISTSSARRAARRGSKICTGFLPNAKVMEIFDAYRDEAKSLGWSATADHLALRRQVAFAASGEQARELHAAHRAGSSQRLANDPRFVVPGRQELDTPVAHAFSLGEEENIVDLPEQVGNEIVRQCREVGAGHFLATFRGAGAIKDVWETFGREVNPVLARASV